MGTVKKLKRLSAAEYLQIEERGEVRHEYVDGMISAMVGSSARHNLIACAILAVLRNHLRGTGCRVFMADMKVHTGTVFYYPDIMVVCDKVDPASLYQTSPVFLAEILSESTEARDRLEKLVAYQGLPSLREYALMAQDKIRIDIYRRQHDGWQLETLGSGESIRLDSVGFTGPVEQFYEDMIRE